MPSLVGTTVAANYLKVVQSPGAAYAGLESGDFAPLLTFSTPNLRLFKVVITGEDLTATPAASDSSYSKVVRALQVTCELFAVFPPSVAGGDSTMLFMAPDFNSNVGAPTTASDPLSTPTFSVQEAAIVAAVGGTATVSYATVSGVTVS